MNWIDAPVLKTYMLRKGELAYVDSITEFGVFSLVLADSRTQKIYFTHVDGLLPRTKQANSNEGGCNRGFAVVDHVLVVDADVNEL